MVSPETGKDMSPKPPERILKESTPEEGEVISRYLDLRIQAYNSLLTNEERTEFAQNLIDLVKLLNARAKMDPEFCEEMLANIKILEDHYNEIREAERAAKQLERESRGGILVPHLYENVVAVANIAIAKGVPASSLLPYEKIMKEYLLSARLHLPKK